MMSFTASSLARHVERRLREPVQLLQQSLDAPTPFGQIPDLDVVPDGAVLGIDDTPEGLGPSQGLALDLAVQNRGDEVQIEIVPLGQPTVVSEHLEGASKGIALENVRRDVCSREILGEVTGHSHDPRAQFLQRYSKIALLHVSLQR